VADNHSTTHSALSPPAQQATDTPNNVGKHSSTSGRSRRLREQRGYVFKAGNWWFLRYWDSVVKDGRVVRKQPSRKLAPVQQEHRRLTRPPEYVSRLAEDFLKSFNIARSEPARNVTLSDFAGNVWFPYVRNRHTASTLHSYQFYWEHILAPRCGDMILREFSTPSGQRLLDEIARQSIQTKKATLHKLKSILSAIFKLAIQQDYRPGPNPMRETSLPRASESEETVAYDLNTVLAMLQVIPEPARTVIAIAAFSGLRRGEIEGLLWESYDGDTLKVMRAMWQGIAGGPKTKNSKGSVPVIGPLRNFLDQHRFRCGNPQTGIMFKTRKNTPLRMNNLLNDQILPALERCLQCGKCRSEHARGEHQFRGNSALPRWHGFHAFRRGLATNLHDLGVDDLTIQRILRHSNVSVTQRCYIKTLPEQSITAMKKLETVIDRSSLLCNERAIGTPA
jgi:integrase